MSGDVRLDAATLEWVAEQMERAQEGADHLRASYVRHKAREARSRPPALSDWVRACEGTGLGEPHWSGERWDDSGQIVAWFRPDMGVVMLIDGDAAPTAAVVTADPRESNGDTYYTPAELRAALEAIAREAPSSGAPS